MPHRPADFPLNATQKLSVRAVLEAWDARDPWAQNAALERQLLDTLDAVTAPRIVSLPSPVHVAKFLREMVEWEAPES